MDPQTEKNNKKISHKAVLLILILAAGALVLSGINRGRARTVVSRPTDIATASADVSPKSGGAIPTKIPTVTPTALTGMDSPLFCKLEMAMIRDKSEMLGVSGMLIPDRYDQSSKTCSFIIRDGKFLTEIGTISTVHTSKENFGVRVAVSEKPGIIKSVQLRSWGTASLLALEKELSQQDAEKLMDTVTETGTAAWNGYEISLEDHPLTKTSTLSIFARPEGSGE